MRALSQEHPLARIKPACNWKSSHGLEISYREQPRFNDPDAASPKTRADNAPALRALGIC